MSDPFTTPIAEVETTIGQLMPTALDMIGTVVEKPGMEWDDYAGLLELADQSGPLLMLAVLRCAAGIAAIGELTGDQVRALGA